MLTDELRFRPSSKEDFSRYARDLAWLLRAPLQSCQELLARIYGYSNNHELQETLRKPGEAGPFDEPLTAASLEKLKGRALLREPERGNRTLELVAAFKGRSLSELDSRFWDAREIGLFCTPPRHREYFQRVKAKHEVLSDSHARAENVLADYVVIAGLETEDSAASVVFTKQGRAVYDAVGELLPDDSASEEAWHKAEKKLWALCEKHPYFPWPFTMLLEHFGSAWWQGPWDEGAIGDRLDADSEYPVQAPMIAKRLLPNVKLALSQFRDLYKKGGGYAAHSHRGSDDHAYPSLLFWGGRVAENAGDVELARRCFTELKRIEPRDRWGARFSLATIRLVSGRGRVAGLFNVSDDGQEEHSAWGRLALAAEAHARGELAAARKHFAAALRFTWAAAEPFCGALEERTELRVMSNIDAPANIQEFMYRTNGFWQEHPETFQFFAVIARAVRARLLAFHRQRAGNFGLALQGLSDEDFFGAQQTERELRNTLEATVTDLET